MTTFEELVAKSLERAANAELSLSSALELHQDPSTPPPPSVPVLLSSAATNATLAEAYARLASAVVVNRTSLNAVLDAAQAEHRGPVS